MKPSRAKPITKLKPRSGNSARTFSTLDKGGEVAPDPFLNAGCLANQNRLASYATEGENASAKPALEDLITSDTAISMIDRLIE
jgi:hypothetical protein